MIILKGYERKQGTFTNQKTGEVIEYDNYTIHVQSDERSECTGLFCENIKCKTDGLRFIGFDDLDEALEHEVILGLDITSTTPVVNQIILIK